MAQARTVYYEGKKSTLYPNGLIKVGGHRNWRNNNPGNIKAGSFTNSHGAIGDDGTFAVFNSMDDGYKAQGELLQSGSYKNLSMHDAIYRWAPPSENDSAGYVRYVAEKTGIDPNKKMSDLTPTERDKMVRAMAEREGIKNGSGDVIEGADVNGNQASGGKKINDPFAGGGSGGGTPGTGDGSDPCLEDGGNPNNPNDPNNPSNPAGKGGMLDKLAQIEGNGSYTQGANKPYSSASGRYQFVASTAESELVATGIAKNKSEASAIWHQCKSSSSNYCQGVQDTIATHYSNSLMKSLPSDQRNMENLYLRYNQGKSGGDIIKKAQANGTNVTNPKIISNMDNQAWTKHNPSHGDPDAFLKGLRGYVKNRGVDPDATF